MVSTARSMSGTMAWTFAVSLSSPGTELNVNIRGVECQVHLVRMRLSSMMTPVPTTSASWVFRQGCTGFG